LLLIGSALAMVLTTIFVSPFNTPVLLTPAYPHPASTAGRVRKGPAPVRLFVAFEPFTSHFTICIQLNLEVPAHDFNDAEGKLVIG
jgi:hypothetical protein